MADHLGLKVEPSMKSFNFVDCSQRSSRGIVKYLESFLVNNRSTCHCEAKYKTEYSASIETHTPTSNDSAKHKSIDNHLEESIDSSPYDWENDYYNPTLAVHTATPSARATLQTEESVTSIDRTVPTSIDTHHNQTNRKRSSTDIAYCTLIDDGVDRAQKGNFSIGSWVDDRYHESYAVETTVHEPEADELHEGFTTEELLNHQEHSDTDYLFAEACGRGTRFYRPFTRAKHPSIDTKTSTSSDIRSQPPSTV
ncbi:hypothetical protein DY000_02007329 [Brassica cretica]|uniref:Uncharacterized protein n=1 Tax=Brassica cretica TaxID=69181 RepID=A0ABQ7CDZ2_BRACR|nr:hypothetical protein DY000_02007329 [Brassica cretica]